MISIHEIQKDLLAMKKKRLENGVNDSYENGFKDGAMWALMRIERGIIEKKESKSE